MPHIFSLYFNFAYLLSGFLNISIFIFYYFRFFATLNFLILEFLYFWTFGFLNDYFWILLFHILCILELLDFCIFPFEFPSLFTKWYVCSIFWILVRIIYLRPCQGYKCIHAAAGNCITFILINTWKVSNVSMLKTTIFILNN